MEICLCLVARVMLTIKDMFWNKAKIIHPEMPHGLIAELDRHSGPTLNLDDFLNVSLFVVTHKVNLKNHKDERTMTQFPVRIAYTIMIHKSQGITQKIMIGLPSKDLFSVFLI